MLWTSRTKTSELYLMTATFLKLTDQTYYCLFKDYEAASNKAGKVEAEVKRLHNLIVDINSHKLKAQQDKLDKINKELDECSSAITKAQVAIKTAGRYVNFASAETCGKGDCFSTE